MPTKQDNSTLTKKVALRQNALRRLSLPQPVIMETHGGAGVLFDACYSHIERGVVFEKSPEKTAVLAKQRPTWAVYEADCVSALQEGVGAHLTVDLLDVDPYGESFAAIEAFFTSARPFADRMIVAVNDGGRNNLELKGAWRSTALQPMVAKYGNDLYAVYLQVCRELVEGIVSHAGYRLAHFAGLYCGLRGKMTHYLAELEKG